MPARHLAALALVGALCATTLHAQDTTVSTGRNLLGIGVNMPGEGNHAPALQLGREWRAPGSRLGFRLTADYTTTESTRALSPYQYYYQPAQGNSYRSSRDATLGLASTILLARGRIQPYLLSGMAIGYHHAQLRYDADPNLPTRPDGSLNFSFAQRKDEAFLALQVGFGISARVAGATLFTEIRGFQPLGSNTYRPEPMPRPLTFGFRF